MLDHLISFAIGSAILAVVIAIGIAIGYSEVAFACFMTFIFAFLFIIASWTLGTTVREVMKG